MKQGALPKLAALLHSQVIGEYENAGNGVGLNAGDALLQLICYDSLERHSPVVNDDVNRRNRPDSQGLKRTVSVNGFIKDPPQLVVAGRER